MPESTVRTPLLTDRVQRAFELASEVHRLRVRKASRSPYLAHLMSVCSLILEFSDSEDMQRWREDAAVAALLHDAVEDCGDGVAMEWRIRNAFGNAVGDIVMGCSDAVAGREMQSWKDRKAAYIACLRSETNREVLLVSTCDKLHKARAIVGDLRSDPDNLWNRFSETDPEAQIGYYEALAECYEGRVPVALSAELTRVIGEMRRLSGDHPPQMMMSIGA